MSFRTNQPCYISDNKQFSIVLRYIKGSKVCKSSMRFVEIIFVTAESISSSVLVHLSRIELYFQKLINQGYDGASTLAGLVSGVKSAFAMSTQGQYFCSVFSLLKLGYQ